MNHTRKHPGLLFNMGLGLLSLVAILDLLISISFALRIPVAAFHFPVAVALMFMLIWTQIKEQCFGKKVKVFANTTGLIVLIIFFSILIAGSFYDLSFDGQTYHQEGVYQLVHFHWNPFYEVLPDQVNQAIWVNHYPKQAESSAAAVYALTGRIETGKCFNLIILAASFFLIYSFLKKNPRINPSLALILSILFAFNPIVIHQALTYMVDGQLASVLLSLLVCCLLLCRGLTSARLLLLACLIVICINIKFTAAVYTALFVGFTLAIFLFRSKLREFSKLLLVASSSSLVAVLLVGFNPYLTNLIQNGNVFYPLLGQHPIDIMTPNSPPGFPEMNRFTKLGLSLFAHTDNIDSRQHGRIPTLKVPFTLNRQDIKSLSDPDNRIAGFGPLFSGVLVLTFFLLFLSVRYGQGIKIHDPLPWFMLMLILSLLVFQEAWWARYIPQLWFIPLIVIILSARIHKPLVNTLRTLTALVIALNTILSLYMVIQTNFLKTAEIDYQLTQFKAIPQPVRVDFRGFDANRIRLAESGIRYLQQKRAQGLVIPLVYSRAVLLPHETLPAPPVPWLLILEERIKARIRFE